MKHLTIMAVAAVALSFTSIPAYAQSSYGGSGQRLGDFQQQETAAEKARRKAKYAERRAKKEARKRAKEAEKAAERAAMKEKAQLDHSSASDGKMIKKNYSSATDATMKKNEPSSATDATMKKKEHSSATDAAMMKKENMVKPIQALPTNCPVGTTPQTNGTCLLN